MLSGVTSTGATPHDEHACRKVLLRRRPLRGGGRIPLRHELPLLELPADDGVAFKPFAGIERGKLRITQGADGLTIFGEENANDTHCRRCGSLLYSVVRDGAFVHVALGSLVDDPGIRPSKHIFVGSKAAWFTITDDLPQYEEHAVAAAR
jgi:hypothetical protein